LLIVIALMVAYSAYFSAYSIQRHNTFRTSASDMGQMDQALWNTLHGHLLEDTRPDGHQAPRLTDHVEPIFLIIPFVFLIYDGIESLFVLQSIVIALGALPIFWIAKRRLRNDGAAIAFAAIYLLFPALQAANLAEFHAVTFAPAPLLFAYNYAQEGAWKRFALFALIALAVKEDIALLVLAMAVWAAVKDQFQGSGFKLLKPETWNLKRINPYPAVIAILSLVWFAIALFVIVPRFSAAGESVYVGRYPQSPLAMIAGIFIPEKIAYVVKLLASVGFIAVFDPLALLVGSPSLVLNLLSSYDAQYSGTYHYSAPVAPYFVLAAIGGAGVLSDFILRGWGRNSQFIIRNSLALVVAPAFVIALGYQMIAGYTPIGGEYFWPETTPHQQLLARFIKQIPPDVPVSTTKTLFPHLSHRRVLYRFPTIKDAEYILLDVSQAVTTNPVDYRMNYLGVLEQGFGIRDAADGYILLQRGLMQKALPDEFYNFLRACPCAQPQQPVTIDFEDKIRFLGYDVRQDDWRRAYLRTYWTRLSGMDNNFALFPFYPDDNGAPRADAQLPDLMFHFWYPTTSWKDGEVIVADTLPTDVGARAKIGVGVFFGATWDNAEFYLAPRTSAPISSDGRWVLIGEIARRGKKLVVSGVEPYEVVK
jgi:uncharacterized membrane protein